MTLTINNSSVLCFSCARPSPQPASGGGAAEPAPEGRDPVVEEFAEPSADQPGLLAALADDSPGGCRALVHAALEDLLQRRSADAQAGLEGTPFVMA